ncbi:class I tRNA ligase family protein [Candidatus Micrarchaeota archaeon]|nr:class I tRNA ligase family protein [Candidatus Micrarchaeota archaeon]
MLFYIEDWRIMESLKKYDPQAVEQLVREAWKKEKVAQKLAENRQGAKKYYLLDGPPYVNSLPHVGHVKTTTCKDIWTRLRYMQGFNTFIQPGFDCHGLPVEVMVEKELGTQSKQDIEKMGVEEFDALCLKKVENNEKAWLRAYDALGAWRAYFEPYFTYKPYYIESAWWTLKRLHEKGFLVEGSKSIHWCPKCETALSGYEVSDSYKDVTDPSIYVKFKVKGKKNEFLLVWTTTPWTLPSNTALAVAGNEEYAKAKVGKEVYILAKKLVNKALAEDCQLEYEIIETFPGSKLDGLKYEPLVESEQQKEAVKNNSAYRVYMSIPIMVRKKYKKHKPTEEALSVAASMTAKHFGSDGQLKTVVRASDAGEEREEFEQFVTVEDGTGIVHTAPGHGQTDQDVNWMPSFGKDAFNNWVSEATDWCISQQRFWGIPIPIWVCDECGRKKVIGSVEELRQNAIKDPGLLKDLHRHSVDSIALKCECGKQMRRIKDIFNVWYDSSISPWASLGYPFRNKELFESLTGDTIVDAINESQDQIRGWFYVLMFTGMAAFDKPAYRNVSMMGWVVDEKGEKMSKSVGNVVWAEDALKQVGADAIRLYYCWDVAPWDVQKFSLATAREVYKSLNILWNSLIFYESYKPEKFKPSAPTLLETEDKWLVSRLNTVTTEIIRHFELFEFHHVGRKLLDFTVNDFSRWYIKLIRDRAGEGDEECFNVLYHVLRQLSLLMAPITPFISDYLWRRLGGKESVHLQYYPTGEKGDDQLEKIMDIAIQTTEAANAARTEAGIKLRAPVKRVCVVGDAGVEKAVTSLQSIMLRSLNSLHVTYLDRAPEGNFAEKEFQFGKVYVDLERDEQLQQMEMFRELTRKIQENRKKAGLHVKDEISLKLQVSDSKFKAFLKKQENGLKNAVNAARVGFVTSKQKTEDKVEDVAVSFSFEKV